MSQRCCVFTNQTEYDVCRRQSPGAIKSRGDEGEQSREKEIQAEEQGASGILWQVSWRACPGRVQGREQVKCWPSDLGPHFQAPWGRKQVLKKCWRIHPWGDCVAIGQRPVSAAWRGRARSAQCIGG